MALTRWWWVRHGPTHEKTFTGWRDVPADLSDTAALGRLSAHLPTDALILSSDLIRARDTATAISTGRQRLADEPDLREIDFGDWDGVHFSQAAEKDPALSRAFWEDPGTIKAPRGESWNDTARRVGACVDALTNAHSGCDIIAVAHFGAILTQVQRARGVSAREVMAQKIDTLSVTCLTFDSTWSLEIVNHRP